MKNAILSVALLACAPVAFAVDNNDPRDRPELGHQIKQAKQEMREKKKASRARFYARKFELKASALRGEDGKK
jgi:hypothetical protein